MRKSNILLSFFVAVTCVIASSGTVYSGGARKTASPAFWIDRIAEPDAIELTEGQIAQLNPIITEKTYQMAAVRDMPEVIGRDVILEWLGADPLPYASGPDESVRFDLKGRKVKQSFYDKISENIDADSVNDSTVRFGFVVDRADLRAAPTDSPVFKKKGGTGFDAFQYSSVYPPEAVALVHVSRDKKWGFFQTRAVRGWMRLDKVAFGERVDIAPKQGPKYVVTDARVTVYKDDKFKKKSTSVPMGTELSAWDKPENSPDNSNDSAMAIAVRFPASEAGRLSWIKAYVKPRGVHVGYLPYTSRNAITQAFKMLGEPYGWGGVKGRRDCSTFVRDVYATFGIILPRNSRQQSLATAFKEHGSEFFDMADLKAALKDVRGGAAIIALNGHIMLYLGMIEDRPYVIHQTFGYVENGRLKVINKTVVSGVEMYAKDRIKSVTEITLPHTGQRKAAPSISARN